MTTSTDIEEFLDGPLVTWLRSCLDDPESLSDYDDLADGVVIHQVLLLIDPEPIHHGVGPSLGNPALRTRNMECIIRNIKALYEEELCQTVIALPDAGRLGREPESKGGLHDMGLLLLLLLGCAVQCPNKQTFIEQIKSLPIDAQHSLVHCIKQVTESQEIVLTQEGSETASTELLLSHIRNLVKQRDSYLQAISTIDEKRQCSVTAVESQHLAVELADWKAKLRKQRQELEEKSETLAETREELEQSRALVTKLKTEMNEVKSEARAWKAYRDEADALREKAERAERLEAEIVKYRERLSDLDYYRVRVEELRQDNRVLEETREMLEEQLARARTRAQYALQLEADLLHQKQQINELSLERDAHQEKLQELFEENVQLTLLSKSALMADNSTADLDQLEDSSTDTGEGSLSEQLRREAGVRALRLELENRRLATTVDSLQEAALHQTNERVLQLEKDKKRLSLQVEELEEAKRKLTLHITELEGTVKNAQRDTKKMQDIRDSLQAQLQSRVDDIETLGREKERFEVRAKEAEEALSKSKNKEEETSSRLAAVEKDLGKAKTTLQTKSAELDKLHREFDNAVIEKTQMVTHLDEAKVQIFRLQEVERELQESERRWEVDRATLTTLQKDLIAEKLVSQELRSNLEKAQPTVVDPDKMALDAEVVRVVRERLECGRAQLEVELSTLQSQILSLTSQHTALQLANSQLVAEKDEVSKELDGLKKEHHLMLVDQLTLQGLHEQLSSEYEILVKERDSLRASVREARSEGRLANESTEKLAAANAALEKERELLKAEAASLTNLRQEHSKLREDFRSLFAASGKVKSEWRNSQDECRRARAVNRELKTELAVKDENITRLEMQLTKVHTQCDVLKQVKVNLEEDRRSLMEHVTLLIGQYHELLTHSLEDKEHYHLEEKMFTDKLNNLCRQKEKLEEKIMEHYRTMECPTKKKSFGANVVRKLRKAGSDLINKGRKSWHEEGRRRGTDSDTSLEDVRTRQDGLGLSTPGTRRTLYLSGDENSASTNDHDESKTSTLNDVPRSSTPQQDPSVLVYNRLTTVVGGGNSTPGNDHTPQQTGSQSQQQPPKEHEIWHEYGCI